MNTYLIETIVEADSEEHALEIAKERLESGYCIDIELLPVT